MSHLSTQDMFQPITRPHQLHGITAWEIATSHKKADSWFLLGICMCIMCLTPSMWKVVDLTKCQSIVETMPILLRVNWQSESLRCWSVNCLLSLLSCHLSSLCWAINCLLYLWTRSLACRHLLSSITMAPWAACARKVRKQCVDLTDIQAQPQTKTQLCPRVWTSH